LSFIKISKQGIITVSKLTANNKKNPDKLVIEPIIAEASKAVKQQNWSLVIQYLQQIPLAQQKNQLYLPERELWEQVFQISWKLLFWGDFQQRWEIAKFIPRLGERVIKPLLALLEDEETELEIRWFICRLLAEFSQESIVIALVKLWQQTEEEELAIAASQTLAQMGTIAIEALINLLAKPESRLLAVRSLAYIRRQETITPLLQVVNDPQPEIRAIAIEALGSFHDERIPIILIQALTDISPLVRREAVIALGLRKDLREKLNLVDYLQPLLYDFNLEVCYQAAFALGRMGCDSSATALFKVLQSHATPTPLKIILVRALSWIETEEVLNYLQESLSIEDDLVTQEIITVLGRIEKPDFKFKASQILVDFFDYFTIQQQNCNFKQFLAMSLGELGSSQGINVLNQLAVDDEQAVRLHAIAALEKLSTLSNYLT
jgi:HEAT repeat protein